MSKAYADIHDALHAGAARTKVMETTGVAVTIGDGPPVACGCEALEAVEQWHA